MLTNSLLEHVLARAQETARHSWEYGVVFEALLEYYDPQLSVFHRATNNPEQDFERIKALQYVKQFIRTDSTSLCEGNGSSADPASLGIPCLLLSTTALPDSASNPYIAAATRQLHTLLSSTPRYPNNAISHRSSYPSLWSDFVYMVPPFLAYYAVFTNDLDLLLESVEQCEHYRDILGTENGAWKHVANTGGQGDMKSDDGAWCTGNAWAAAGMSRVLATLVHSQYASQTARPQASLIDMTKDILDAAIQADTHGSGLLRNYLDDESWFGEVAGTALMTATVFRVAVLEPEIFQAVKYTAWAERKVEAIGRHVDSETGIAAPVVNSLKEGQRTPLDGINPEAQAFVVLMFAAWRDWKQATKRHG